ncbi:MAG: hypothetical protein HY015_11200 [Bacteroidetes bacterium]|nr:hypothetical protein [Bacteroidota bacterium]MBI3483517.1 hypothetical protein [Bacteroidota bacterium]
MNLSLRNFFIKLFHWEYWPFGIIQLPLMVLWLWYSLKERSLFYFSASNPGILTGGMLGESKFEVHSLLPEEVKPKTLLIKFPSALDEVTKKMSESSLHFPIIFKPDLGERGWMVKRINNDNEVEQYLSEIKIDFIIQELVDLPLEFGVYYVRYPNEDHGFVNSITGKEFLHVQGDGKKTLQQLIFEKDRARLQWGTLKEKYHSRLNEIIPSGEKVELVSIGNHCLGTLFLNSNHLITEKLSASFDRISKQVKGFYFGRYDLRCASTEDLENGKVKIVELNGCGAEPSHIYHPNASFWKGVRDLITHWKNMYLISKANHKRGVEYISFREGFAIYKKFSTLKS